MAGTRFSSRTLKSQMMGVTPGTMEIASSPSNVLQIQPLREIFWRMPARSPSEYDQDRTTHRYSATSTTGTTRTTSTMDQARPLTWGKGRAATKEGQAQSPGLERCEWPSGTRGRGTSSVNRQGRVDHPREGDDQRSHEHGRTECISGPVRRRARMLRVSFVRHVSGASPVIQIVR